ncbi:DNA polymerase V protein UmuD [Tenacibaculum sp. 190524A02b]|uniref:LexA family protein n=1 Tax=Tenacibaculum vairaonense TaxID=3137860 RepID=UPI0032B25126
MKIINLPKFSSEIEIVSFQVNGEEIKVNYFPDGVQAGFPSPADDFKEEKLSLDKKYLTNPDATYIVKVKGNSMFPTLEISDLLIVKSDLRMEDNDIVIVSVNNTEFTVKRFDKSNNILLADNPEFSNIEIQEEDTLICLGVVKNLIRDI